MMSIREARLRPEGADRYPGVPVGEWVPAFRIAAEAQALAGGAMAQSRQRLLADDVFEFRGGAPEMALRRRARTRWVDYPAPVAASRRAIPSY
ncbi:MAG TPA: hypothetical protein VHR41_18515 [Gemmatimonadales bacterium]|jgi:hypothetical protein|nr:hypothetical protein [Gemmatimonadales bacterium]